MIYLVTLVCPCPTYDETFKCTSISPNQSLILLSVYTFPIPLRCCLGSIGKKTCGSTMRTVTGGLGPSIWSTWEIIVPYFMGFPNVLARTPLLPLVLLTPFTIRFLLLRRYIRHKYFTSVSFEVHTYSPRLTFLAPNTFLRSTDATCPYASLPVINPSFPAGAKSTYHTPELAIAWRMPSVITKIT